MPGPFEPTAKRFEIEDLTIKDQADGAVLVGHRLASPFKIDNAQPAKPQSDPDRVAISIVVMGIHPCLRIIGPAMRDRIGHFV